MISRACGNPADGQRANLVPFGVNTSWGLPVFTHSCKEACYIL